MSSSNSIQAANLFVGPNASGKTSLLEAAFFLSRGRSFRSRRRDALITHGQDAFVLSGLSLTAPAPAVLGVRASRSGTEWHVGGAVASGIADLAEQFAAQVIDPEVHKLLEEGPGRRRRFLDWGVFHVEPSFLPTWRRYHQALRQRNAALKQDGSDEDLAAWEQELASSGEALAQQRESYLARIGRPLAEIGEIALLDRPITLAHHPGWDSDRPLLEVLRADRRRDRRYRATQSGPASRRRDRAGRWPGGERPRVPRPAKARGGRAHAGAARSPGTGTTGPVRLAAR